VIVRVRRRSPFDPNNVLIAPRRGKVLQGIFSSLVDPKGLAENFSFLFFSPPPFLEFIRRLVSTRRVVD